MADSGFFGWVWRFNALVIAIAASGVIVALFAIFSMVASNFVREVSSPREFGLVEGDARSDDVSYALGRAEAAEGTDIALHTLDRTVYRPHVLQIKSRYSYDSDVVNLLVVNDNTTTARWMYDGVEQALHARSFIFDPATLQSDGGARRATALLIHVSDNDTNKDGIVDAADASHLMVYKLSDGSRTELVRGVLRLASVRQSGNGNVSIMYEAGEHTILASYDPQSFRLLAKSELPRLSTGGAGEAQ